MASLPHHHARPSLLSRLRWTADEPLPQPLAERAVLARAYAYLFTSGASLVLLTLALPHERDVHVGVLLAAAGLAYATVVVLIAGFERLPPALLAALPALGTVLVSVVVVAGGAAASSAYALLYFWVVLAAHYFFPPRFGAMNTAFVAVAYAAVLAVTPNVSAPEVKWAMAAGSFGVAGLLMSLLRDRVARLFGRLERHAAQSDALALLGRAALDPELSETLPESAVRVVRETLGVERVELLLLDPAGRRFTLAAADGPASGLVAMRTVEVRGREDVHGALVAHSLRPGAFGPQEEATLEAVATLLGGAIDRERAAERLRHQAFHDDLTGQPNRHLFMERLGEALERARRQERSVAVLFVDLDHFKVVNDSLGHAAGDALLVSLVPRFREALTAADTLARFGGDEFVILCEEIEGEAGALCVAERLHASLEERFQLGSAGHRLTASIGVALADGGRMEPQTLLRNADAALSRAKAAGRDRTAIYDAGMHRGALDRLRLENALRDALALGQLRLEYQPVVDLQTGLIDGCEALLRWRHPELGEVSPAEIIPVAEETGLIVPIGEWVIGEACRTAARWHAAAGPAAPVVGVNVSARQLAEKTLPGHIASVLRATGLDAGDLVVEITESALLDDSSEIAARLAELRALGVHLALDDFGTGWSSLSYLQRFPVHTLKIDRSFVAPLEDGEDAIVGAVVGMAAGLGVSVVAEGVETPAQLDRLRALGCRFAQGYLFARPLPPAEVAALLASGGVVPAGARAAATVS